jgi:hypothetical protein
VRTRTYAPQHRTIATTVERVKRQDADMASGNTAAWEARSAPLAAHLATGGKTMGEIRDWARSRRERIAIIEESLYWLLAQNRVVRELGVWRLVRRVA